MQWYKTYSEEQIAEGSKQLVKLGGNNVLILRHAGEIYAISNTCPHMTLPLRPGTIEDGAIVCPWHRSAFDLRTGDVKAWSPWPPGIGPMVGKLSREKALPIYATKIEDGTVYVELP